MTKLRHPPELDQLWDHILYDKESGRFFALTGRKQGREIGVVLATGYRSVKYKGRMYRGGRLAFFYINGRFPEFTIDHINGRRDDDRWCNLREATHVENSRNKSVKSTKRVKVKGAYFRPRNKSRPWQASIFLDGRSKSLGFFATAEEANEAYAEAAKRHFGEFAKAA